MPIHKLPDYIINRLKAWEIVSRPVSIIKELVENSLDAWSDKIIISVDDWWKSLISIEDNGDWIQLSDMDLVLERYATSKINSEDDLLNIKNYWFRWEALASIAEVSKITLISKTKYAEIATKLIRRWGENIIKNVPVWFTKWTIVTVQDLFYNVPARLKFLKSSQTEFYYCYNYFVDISLLHYDKHFILKKNGKVVFDLNPANWLIDRVNDLYKKDLSKNLKDISYEDDLLSFNAVTGDSTLRFGSAENIKIYVNSRPIEDKVIKKALMDAYYRQITHWEYPMAILIFDIKPEYVDVNVHPSKLQVKFWDSRKIYEVVYNNIKKILSDNRVSWSFDLFENRDYEKKVYTENNILNNSFENKELISNDSTNFYIQWSGFFDNEEEKLFENEFIWEYKIVWQLWNSYIVIESKDSLFYVDQHALAERIAFEKMKKERDLKPELLLQPLKFEIINIPNVDKKIQEINKFWFDCSLISENNLVIYSVPKVFVLNPVDLTKLLNHVLYLDDISYDHMLDWLIATRACKTSIKAWHRLSMQQMSNLIKDGFENIEWLFVCQHGRPFFIQMEKKNIDKMFDRT